MKNQSKTISGPKEILIPIRLKKTLGCKQVLLPQTATHPSSPPSPLAILLARALRWQELLDNGQFNSIGDLAQHLDMDRSWVARILRLTTLAPDIVTAILNGQEPDHCTQALLRGKVPLLWVEQRKELGFPTLA